MQRPLSTSQHERHRLLAWLLVTFYRKAPFIHSSENSGHRRCHPAGAVDCVLVRLAQLIVTIGSMGALC
eukprot:scaffold239060_cov26-Tisochrysis_lutea.AAC.1